MIKIVDIEVLIIYKYQKYLTLSNIPHLFTQIADLYRASNDSTCRLQFIFFSSFFLLHSSAHAQLLHLSLMAANQVQCM